MYFVCAPCFYNVECVIISNMCWICPWNESFIFASDVCTPVDWKKLLVLKANFTWRAYNRYTYYIHQLISGSKILRHNLSFLLYISCSVLRATYFTYQTQNWLVDIRNIHYYLCMYSNQLNQTPPFPPPSLSQPLTFDIRYIQFAHPNMYRSFHINPFQSSFFEIWFSIHCANVRW